VYSSINFGVGVVGYSSKGTGVEGDSSTGLGVYASSSTGIGVEGSSDSGYAVAGFSGSGNGVFGSSNSGNGVFGSSNSGYAGFFNGKALVNGTLRVASIPGGGTYSGHVCFNPGGDLLYCEGSTAQSSSLRYKTNVQSFRPGLNIIRRLRPISFTWKRDGLPDIGLAAEEVAQVAPSFVSTNSNGQVEGVKYERLNIVLINAVKEQQQQLETLRAQNAALNARLRALERRQGKRRR